jgi:alginate O-acetyltransferase complex protein AlgI
VLFSSPIFFAFFAAYFALHAAILPRQRIWLIIFGGLIFYSYWYPGYFWIPPLYLAIVFPGALWIAQATEPRSRKLRLTVVVVALLLPLAIFKYANFFYRDVLGPFLGTGDRLLDLPLPLGVSFITFTLIAYAVDVYRGAFAVERRPEYLAGHLIFFPHLIAGPILRPHELIPQLERPAAWRSADFLSGISIFTVGLVKKLVIADPIAAAIDPIFSNPSSIGWADAAVATYGFSVQIYCDFSGYTDMAIGLALMLGISLPNNFERPYAASSIIDFWRRWHITLSYWLRDYLYIPLGGNRRGLSHQLAAILATMTLGGLWHGANWTFVVWGAIHGAAVSINHLIRRLVPGLKLPAWLGIVITFHVVTLAWIPFRSPNLSTAGTIVSTLLTPAPVLSLGVLAQYTFPIFLIVVALVLHALDDHERIRNAARKLPLAITIAVLGALWALAVTVSAGSSAAFIYFDF